MALGLQPPPVTAPAPPPGETGTPVVSEATEPGGQPSSPEEVTLEKAIEVALAKELPSLVEKVCRRLGVPAVVPALGKCTITSNRKERVLFYMQVPSPSPHIARLSLAKLTYIAWNVLSLFFDIAPIR